jgi:uncharacterized protein (DUF983 family)
MVATPISGINRNLDADRARKAALVITKFFVLIKSVLLLKKLKGHFIARMHIGEPSQKNRNSRAYSRDVAG